MTCKCGSERIAHVSAKVSDRFNLETDFGEPVCHRGYVPSDIGLGGGDYMHFAYCLDCGQINGRWPAKIDLKALLGKEPCALSDDS